MQRGVAGAAIITMVLAATILVGYVVSDPKTVEVTTYDSLSDLGPIVLADPASEYVEYYPAGNVTGWSGDVSLPLTDSATIYVYTPASSSYTKVDYEDMAGANGVYITPGQTSNNGGFATQRSGISASYNGTTSSGYVWMGAASNNTYSSIVYPYNDTVYKMALNGSAASGVYWIDLAALAATFTQDMAISAPGLSLYSDVKFSESSQSVQIPGKPTQYRYTTVSVNISGEPVAVAGDYIYYQKSTDAWYSATHDETFGFVVSGSALGSNLRFISDSPSHAWSLYTPEVLPTQYVLPNTPVTVNGHAYWSNGQSNGLVKILMNPSLDGYFNGSIIPEDPSGNGFADAVNPPYDWILLTLDALSGTSYWQGVKDYVSPSQYTVVDYIYELGATPTIEDLSALTFVGDGQAYIVQTYIALDPKGVLWKNPNMNLSYYFPAAMANGARVLFNGFVVTGDSLTINGHTYTVDGSRILVDGELHKLAGMAVDYRIDGHTYLVFTQESNAEYDLGASSASKQIDGSGTWYYTAELQAIKTQIKESNSIVFGGWNMDKTTACLVFVGFLVVGAVGGAYLIPGGLRPLDWIVLIAAGAVALCIM